MAVLPLATARTAVTPHRRVLILTACGLGLLMLAALAYWSVRTQQGIVVGPAVADQLDGTPLLTDVRLSSTHPLVGEIIRIGATYTNPEPRSADVRFRLFITREEYHLFGAIPPRLITIAPHAQERGEIRFLITTPGPLGAQAVVTNTDLTKLAEQTLPELQITAASLPVVLLALALGVLAVAGAPAWCILPLLRSKKRRHAAIRYPRGIKIVAALTPLPLAVVALTPALHATAFVPLSLLVGFPVLLVLLPAMAFRVGTLPFAPALAVIGSGIVGALFALIALGVWAPVLAMTVACAAAALAGDAYRRRRLDRMFWAILVAAVVLLMWGYLDAGPYAEQAFALIAGA